MQVKYDSHESSTVVLRENSIHTNVDKYIRTYKYYRLQWLVCIRGETIRINAILRIAFECIAIYCHIAIFDWILVKRHFIWKYGFWQ